MDKCYYQPFIPDYNVCENSIRTIGYNIDESSLVGHRLLLHRSHVDDKVELWIKHERNCIQCEWEKCLKRQRIDHLGTSINKKMM